MQRFRRREFEKREGLRPAEFGKALLLIVGSIFAIAFSENSGWLRVLALVLEGGALLFILQTSDAHRRFLPGGADRGGPLGGGRERRRHRGERG
jgi:hypothetical protein